MKQSLLQIAQEEEAEAAAALLAANPPTATAQVDLPPDEVDDIELDMGEATGDELELGEAFDDTDETMTNMSTLSELADILEGAGTEGVDPVAAEIITVGTESIWDNMGLSSQKVKNVVAVESFGSTMSRRDATKLALESLTDGIKKVWIAIKATVAKIAAKLGAFIASFFDTNAKMLKKAIELQSKIHSVGETPKATKIAASSSIRELTGGSSDFAKISKGLSSCILLVKNTDKSIKSFSTYLGETQRFKLLAADPASFDKLEGFDFSAGMQHIDQTREYSGYKSEELPGNRAILVSQPSGKAKGGAEVSVQLTKTTITVGEFSKNTRPAKEGAEYLVLSKAKMGIVISEVVQILTAIESSKEGVSRLEAAHKSMIHELDMVSVVNTGSQEDRGRIRQLQQIAVSLNRLSGSMMVVSNRIAARAAYGAIDYVEASLKQYGVE